MNRLNNKSDSARLETLAREAYSVMANEMAYYSCFDSLVRLKRFIKTARMQGGPVFTFRGQSMGFHVFPFLTDLIVRHSTVLTPTRQFGDNTVAWLLDKYMDFPEVLQFPTGTRNLNQYMPEWLVRTAFEQLSSQEMTRTLVPRMLYLYNEIPLADPPRHHRFLKARDEVLQNQYRVNLDELLLCTFALGAIADTADRFTSVLSTEVEWLKPYVESDVMEIVRSQLTLSRDEYKVAADDQFSRSYVHIRTEPPLILRYPIVRFDNSHVVTDHHLLMARVTKHLHDSVYQYFIDNGRIQDYSGSFGEVFKDYVGEILRDCYGNKNVFDLDKVDGLGGRKADWLVIVGNSAGIFECKGHRYPRELKRTGSTEVLASFVDEKIHVALKQVQDTEKHFGSLQATIPATRGVDTIGKYIVLPEQFHFANIMSDFLPENSTVADLAKNSVMIASAIDLETVVCSNYSSDFSSVFVKWPSNLVACPTLEQHVRGLYGFQFRSDSFLDRKFNEFFHYLD